MTANELAAVETLATSYHNLAWCAFETFDRARLTSLSHKLTALVSMLDLIDHAADTTDDDLYRVRFAVRQMRDTVRATVSNYDAA